ncbi:MAG: recombinase family protein [Ktedonobacteraceae bacterium]|nr:recombinase family protein [Ktedonobacteraceae bacterium]
MVHQVAAHHLKRLACLYVRQSTLQQVFENTESTARQYALRERALALGWAEESILVIDQDLGHSAASTADRLGFQRLVASVGLGQVGLVLGLEVSRLARNSSDWHQLLEICALTQTLILDEEGLYDPSTFNDRLLLGLKGAMSEAELFVMRARLQGGILNKARRGALKLALPVGLCYTEANLVVLDPDLQVQAAIREIFLSFQHTGSAFATVRHFHQQHLLFPRRIRRGPHQGELAWGAIQHHDVLRVLHQPAYAGAYVFGRTRTTKSTDGKIHIQELPRPEWDTLVKNAHVGYITWEGFERNEAQLAMNSQAYAPERFSPPREGPALLQGLILCGKCGERMTVRYHQRGGQRIVPDYLCQHKSIEQGEPPCQRIPGSNLDQAIGTLLLEHVTPEALALTLAVQDELLLRVEEAQRLRHLQVERAQYEADLAQRRYLKVDPDNRLVATVLEAEWNTKLRELEEARAIEEQYKRDDQYQVSTEERAEIEEVPARFRQFWENPKTTVRQRKRAVRLVIEDVTVHKTDRIVAHIRFKGGATQTIAVPLPPPFAQSRLTAPETLAEMDRLLKKYTDAEVAEQLNQRGYRTFDGHLFETIHVYQLRRHHGIPDRYARLRAQGMLTAKELASRYGVSAQVIWRRYHQGRIAGVRYNGRGSCLFFPPDEE